MCPVIRTNYAWFVRRVVVVSHVLDAVFSKPRDVVQDRGQKQEGQLCLHLRNGAPSQRLKRKTHGEVSVDG